jgi:hypothetical protein
LGSPNSEKGSFSVFSKNSENKIQILKKYPNSFNKNSNGNDSDRELISEDEDENCSDVDIVGDEFP